MTVGFAGPYPGTPGTPVSLLQAIVKADWPRCFACDRRPDRVRVETHYQDDNVDLVVFCHGAKAIFTLSAMRLSFSGYAAEFAAKLRCMFVDHASPDVKELLKYNREVFKFPGKPAERRTP